MANAAATRPRSGDDTASRVLDVAERLFAQNGIEATTVREITAAAGANGAAIHYHFGSKNQLVQALLDRRMAQMEQARLPLIREALDAGEVSVTEVMRVWLAPLVELCFARGRKQNSYLGVLARLQSSPAELRALAAASFQPQHDSFGELLACSLPDVPEPTRWFRFALVASATIRALADVDRMKAFWSDHGTVSDSALVAELAQAMTGTLLGGPSSPSRP